MPRKTLKMVRWQHKKVCSVKRLAARACRKNQTTSQLLKEKNSFFSMERLAVRSVKDKMV